MANVIEVDRETAHFHTRDLRSSFASTFRETAQLNDSLVVTPFFNAHEVAQFSDAAFPSAFSLLHELLKISDAALPSLVYDIVARDVVRINDRATIENHAVFLAHEVAYLDDAALANPSARLHEVARLNDALLWGSTIVQALHEVARFSDAAFPHNAARLHEVALLNDAISDRLHQRVNVREVAQLGDAVVATFIQLADLHEVFFATDHTFPTATRRPVLHEIFYVDDMALPPPTGRAYTCSILTWGMSTYQNYPFLTQAGNYGAGQNLWRLDATDDYGAPIPAWITTGRIEIGTSHGKRPTVLYAAGSSLAPLSVVVSGDVGGQLASYSYAMDLRDQTDYRNNKAPLGKGFRSRYLQFKLGAPKYLGFRLLTAEVDLAVSPRRVG